METLKKSLVTHDDQTSTYEGCRLKSLHMCLLWRSQWPGSWPLFLSAGIWRFVLAFTRNADFANVCFGLGMLVSGAVRIPMMPAGHSD